MTPSPEENHQGTKKAPNSPTTSTKPRRPSNPEPTATKSAGLQGPSSSGHKSYSAPGGATVDFNNYYDLSNQSAVSSKLIHRRSHHKAARTAVIWVFVAEVLFVSSSAFELSSLAFFADYSGGVDEKASRKGVVFDIEFHAGIAVFAVGWSTGSIAADTPSNEIFPPTVIFSTFAECGQITIFVHLLDLNVSHGGRFSHLRQL